MGGTGDPTRCRTVVQPNAIIEFLVKLDYSDGQGIMIFVFAIAVMFGWF